MTGRPLDHGLTADAGGDDSGNPDFDDISPIDGDDVLAEVAPPDLRYSRLSGNTHSSYDMSPHSRASSYGYSSSDSSYRQSHGRMPYPSGQQRGTTEISLESPRVSQNMGSSHQYQQSYLQSNQNHTQSPTIYASEHISNPHGSWEPATSASRGEHARSTQSNWLGSHDRSLAGHAGDRSQTYPPAGGQYSLNRATSPAPTRSSGASSPNYPFPALTTPFYPNQTPLSGHYSSSTSTSSGLPSPAQPYHSSSSQPTGRTSASYENRSYASSPSPSIPYPSSSSRDLHMYQQQSQHTSVPSISSLSVPHIHSSSTSSSSSSHGYWPRDKIDGHGQ